MLSRQLARLEADLGARLLQRSTRRLTLTEIGEEVLSQAQHIERALANIEQLSGQHQQEAAGRLRVTCPRPLSQLRLMPLLVEFTRLHPKVEVVLTVADELARGELVKLLPDCTCRAGQPSYLVYPARSWLAFKTSTFVTFLQERLFA